MRVLCEYAPCGPSFVRSGWARAFSALGHDFAFWQPEAKGALDAFGEFRPDVFLGTTYGLDRALLKALARSPDCKVGLFASAWGPLADRVPDDYPITRVTPKERANVESLLESSGRPHFVFTHATETFLQGLLGGWEKAGVKTAGVLNAADTFAYGPGRVREEFRSDVSFIGGWWDYKAINLGPCLLPLCLPGSGLNVKVWGNQKWPVANYLGPLADEDAKDVFASALVCPNVSEPHSTDPTLGYDLVERPFKVMAAGGFCVSDNPRGFRELFSPEELVTYETPAELHDLVKYFVKNPEKRIPFVERGREKVLENHTYFHRVAQMLELFGLPEEARKCLRLHAKTCSPSTSTCGGGSTSCGSPAGGTPTRPPPCGGGSTPCGRT